MKHSGGDLKVKWNHYGRKFKIILTQEEMAQDDVFEILLQKIRQHCPDFDGVLASYDTRGDENIVATDGEFRELIALNRGRLKIYTVRRYLSAHPSRSHSVPLDITRLRQQPSRSISCLRSPPPSYSESQKVAMLRTPGCQPPVPHCAANPFSCVPRPGFGYAYAHYGVGNGRYGQSLIYGYPPQSSMMYSFLCSPFPFGGYHGSWICGPKCFTLSLGGKYHRSKCTSWWNTF